jgi:hypothetical protein
MSILADFKMNLSAVDCADCDGSVEGAGVSPGVLLAPLPWACAVPDGKNAIIAMAVAVAVAMTMTIAVAIEIAVTIARVVVLGLFRIYFLLLLFISSVRTVNVNARPVPRPTPHAVDRGRAQVLQFIAVSSSDYFLAYLPGPGPGTVHTPP